MNWPLAIERNREALLRVVVALFASAGLVPGRAALGSQPEPRLPNPVYRAILRVLRPAESAVRRLIVIVERTMAWEGFAVAAPAVRAAPAGAIPRGKADHVPVFALLDTLKRFDFDRQPQEERPQFRISVPGFIDPVFAQPTPPSSDDDVDAGRLCRRLESLHRALDDLPGQATRLARLRARRDRSEKPHRQSPMRPGRPPGHRARPIHEIDGILRECHLLARDALAPPDT